MPERPATSRQRYARYREDLAAFRTEGSARTAAAHKQNRTGRRSAGRLIVEFFQLLGNQRGPVYLSLGMLAVSTLLALIPPYSTKFVVDYVLGDEAIPAVLTETLPLPEDKRQLLFAVAAVVVVIAFITLVVSMWSRWIATRATKHMQSQVRKRVFEHAVRLPLYSVQKMKSGGVASVLREDAGGVAELIFGMLYNPMKAIITLAGCLIILAFVDWRLLLGSLVLLPVVFLTHRTWISRIRPLWRDIRASRQGVDGHATETFGGMRVVRAFGRQTTEANRFLRNNHVMIRQEILAWWWSRSVDIAWSILIPVASAALLLYGGLRVLDGAITIGDLVMFLAYLALLLNPLATLATSATQFQNALAGLDRVLDLLARDREMPVPKDAPPLIPARVRGQVALNHVSFAYPGSDERVLEEITFEAKAGEMIAFVGPSGAGKTTLCNLIARFYDPTDGSITLDGRDLRDFDVEQYRRILGIVEQDIFLFDGTIAENIGYGKRNTSEEMIIDAARRANADEFISEFRDGYETLIGERGVRLSGGQRQRIAIARAMLADPRILILDEATSNLDTQSERLIQESLTELMKGRTTFAIAHRLSTIMHADRIIVVDHGRVIEAGTHEELMDRSGSYRRMVQLQTAPAEAMNGRTVKERNGAAVSGG